MTYCCRWWRRGAVCPCLLEGQDAQWQLLLWLVHYCGAVHCPPQQVAVFQSPTRQSPDNCSCVYESQLKGGGPSPHVCLYHCRENSTRSSPCLPGLALPFSLGSCHSWLRCAANPGLWPVWQVSPGPSTAPPRLWVIEAVACPVSPAGACLYLNSFSPWWVPRRGSEPRPRR